MDLLKAELERKRKAVELAKSSSSVARIEAPNRSRHRKDDKRSSKRRGDVDEDAADKTESKKRKQYLKTADLRRFEERRLEEEEERRRRGRVSDHDDGDAARRTKKKKRRKRYDDDSSDDEDDGDDDVGHAAGARDASRGDDVDGSPRTCDVDGSDRRGVGEYGRSRTGRSGREEESSAATAARNDNNEDGDDGAAAKVRFEDNEDEKEDEDNDAELHRLTPHQITSMLRTFGLPVRLFGERQSTRLSRLRAARKQQKAAQAVGSEMDEFRLGSGHGIRNPFLERNSQKNKGGGMHDDGKDGKKGGGAKTGDGGGDAKASTSTAAAAAAGALGGGSGILLQDDAHEEDDVQDDPHKKIHRFFKNLLRQWEDDLAHRPDAAKRTAAGKTETKTLKQCRDYIRPLFKLCKSRRLEGAMMNHILKIVDYCEQGEFVKAHDAYMDVAIGRAAWPIGVTMVGIHARSGRAKIESSNVAHVMNSELQRKYLTSVKRIMSYYQKKRVDVPPSKKVMNM